ncbi:MAG: TIGR02466 family protein [Gammaproteobacteria bacterium]
MSTTESNASMQLKVLFPTFINECRYPAMVEEKDGLVDRIYAIRDEDEVGRQFSAQQYPHGFTSYRSRDRLFNDPVFANLVKFLYDCAYDYGRKQHWDWDNFEPLMTQMWCNINSQYSYHGVHNHPYSQISGVIYIKVGENAPAITFRDPRLARWMVPPPAQQSRPENSLVATLPPEEGKTFMFPSWLEHGVAQNQTDVDRISMSYNFELRQKQPQS